MTNTSAQTYARDGAELGDLKRRHNDSHVATMVRTPAEQAQALIDTMEAAKLNRNREAFYAAQQQLKALVEAL